MPFLRFTRDRRGYENTYLVQTVRRRGREHGRVLYWFRSPPQVKIGRAAIDEDAIRALEEQYPEIEFDWTSILEARPVEPEPEDERRTRRARRDREGPREPRRELVPKAPAMPSETADTPPPDSSSAEGPPATGTAEEVAREPLPVTTAEPGLDDIDLEPVEADIEEEEAAAAPPVVGHASEPSAAAEALGSEGLLRLRARYAEVCARIATQVDDEARRDALRTLAEQLDPDAWVTSDDVRAGLEQFEQVLDQIRREVGPPRRRTRRGGRRNRRRRDGAEPAGDAPPSSDPDGEADEDDGGGSNA